MAVVRLGPNGEVEVLEPATPEEIVAAEAGLQRVIAALVRLAIAEATAGEPIGGGPTPPSPAPGGGARPRW